jgi:hypothetical protein
MRSLFLVVALTCLVASPVQAGIASVEVDGSELTAELSLLGGTAAELTITFEDVVGLSESNMGLSVSPVSLLDLSLLGRLPSTLTSLLGGFPLLLTVEPPTSGGLSFEGVVTIELYTHDLLYASGCPFRLFAASLGGGFVDITESHSSGSYRVAGVKGGFSQFLILADLRSVDTVIGGKFDRLGDLLTAYASDIDSVVLAQLESLLVSAHDFYQDDKLVQAIQKIEQFESKVEQHSGSDIPDVWRSARDLDNVAGLLRAAAGTLRFSLGLKSNS